MFVTHVSNKVRASDIVLYLVGGNSVLARMLLRMLACANDGDVAMNWHIFEEEEINLWHHGQDGSPVKTHTQKCMEYLTTDVDANEMLRDSLVVCQWDL